jgi:hypothetical protein
MFINYNIETFNEDGSINPMAQMMVAYWRTAEQSDLRFSNV